MNMPRPLHVNVHILESIFGNRSMVFDYVYVDGYDQNTGFPFRLT
jgi:hypothetical protein